jgi:hypothetical protein
MIQRHDGLTRSLKRKQGNSCLGREMYNIPDMINISQRVFTPF